MPDRRLSDWLAQARELWESAYGPQAEPVRVTLSAGGDQRVTYLIPVRPTPDTHQGLSQLEADVLTALGRETLPAREIARKAGYRLNSHFRQVLADMRRRGLLTLTLDGYQVQTPAPDR